MNKKEPSLSNKITDDLRGGGQLGLRIEDVKKAVERLNEVLKKHGITDVYNSKLLSEINKIFGDDLIWKNLKL